MEPLIAIPTDREVTDNGTSLYWTDDYGIICSISKKVPHPSFDNARKTVEAFRNRIGDRKVCILIDVTHSTEISRENRDYAAAEFPKFVKAIAMVSRSPLGKMLANLFFTIKTQPYPTKMFNNENEAREWLKQYL